MIIEINNLRFSYQNHSGYNQFKLRVDDWSVKKGTFLSLLGPNGSGKSTLLKLILRFIEPEKGNIFIDGININDYKRKDLAKRIAYVPQKISSAFPYSVYETVMMGRTPYMNFMGFEKEEDRRIVKHTLEMFEIDHIKHKGINEISGGELQRVMIARAVAQNTSIILLDEPNAHLDIEHQVSIYGILNELRKQKKITVIAVTHDLNLAGVYSDDIAFMVNGSIVISGKKNEVLNEKNIKEIFKVNVEIIKYKDDILNVLVKPDKLN
ncbi:ABC transporter ATP-binding protein [Melioribacter sp. OK-6-Me]|uniref:ABC transporter ATP-binding protein n=1 Tax=unclassified Melioribacter TaxID=2627329 RepID=UPI003ED9E7E8